jgi:hypothetical protein
MGLPSWAVGRTSAEGFQLANQLYQQSLAGGAGHGAATAAQPQYNASASPAPYGGSYAAQPTPGGGGGPPPPPPPTQSNIPAFWICASRASPFSSGCAWPPSCRCFAG